MSTTPRDQSSLFVSLAITTSVSCCMWISVAVTFFIFHIHTFYRDRAAFHYIYVFETSTLYICWTQSSFSFSFFFLFISFFFFFSFFLLFLSSFNSVLVQFCFCCLSSIARCYVYISRTLFCLDIDAMIMCNLLIVQRQEFLLVRLLFNYMSFFSKICCKLLQILIYLFNTLLTHIICS